MVALLTFVGFFFCCIGAVVVMFFTYFYGYYVLDRDQGATESVSSSFAIVRENMGSVAGLLILIVLINIFTCGLGAGVTFIAGAYAYKCAQRRPDRRLIPAVPPGSVPGPLPAMPGLRPGHRRVRGRAGRAAASRP